MYKVLSIALLAVGILLIVWGVRAGDSFSSDVSRFFTGSPTDKTVWMLIGGSVASLAGLAGLFISPKAK
ncbi:MAG: DUF3185 family protein [Deltaproteobacteria bacterium]|nr:DUF3185 family protein [Deltaproteobacteria bacterium]